MQGNKGRTCHISAEFTPAALGAGSLQGSTVASGEAGPLDRATGECNRTLQRRRTGGFSGC